MSKHRQPIDDSPSPFLVQSFEQGLLPLSGDVIRALDMPCGFGRNANFLASKYASVIVGDYDQDMLASRWFSGYKNIHPVLLNGRLDLPFRDGSFDLATVIHFYDASLLRNIWRVLKPMGVLLLETIGNRGNNWRELPLSRDFEVSLTQYFEPLSYRQKAVHKAPEHSTYKVVARKKF